MSQHLLDQLRIGPVILIKPQVTVGCSLLTNDIANTNAHALN